MKILVCELCKKVFPVDSSRRGPTNKFCSAECREKNERQYRSAIISIFCKSCGASIVRKNGTIDKSGGYCQVCTKKWIAECVAKKYAGIQRTCTCCSEQFTTAGTSTGNKFQKYCSNKCANRMALSKKRAVRRKGFVEDVSIGVLLKKNRSICGICGMVIPKDVCHPHSMSATIDHIVPMSLGGLHSYDNTQPAHRKCNILKRANLVGWTYEKN